MRIPAQPGTLGINRLVAAAALDPSVTLTLFDAKQVELAPWVGCADTFVGPHGARAVEVLTHLRAEMDARYERLLAEGRRKVTATDGLGLHVVAIDELAYFLRGGAKADRDGFAEGLRDLVSRGRAAGIVVLAATQKPSHDIVPTAVRDLFSFRLALRCTTPEASDTVLGQGWASQGYSAATVDPAVRGVGFLLAEGGLPVKFRAAYLDDRAVAAIAERAGRLRGSR
jgi:DNA segregation ATPase FtsK/SpoIIIE-like protein